MRKLAYPSLWKGCVGAWCPSVDRARGSVQLTDQSKFGNHGTLTNMDAAVTNWVASDGKVALAFDGVNDTVEYGTPVLQTSASLCMWIKLNVEVSIVNEKTGFAVSTSSASASHYPWTNGTAYIVTFRTSRVDNITLSTAVTRTRWHLVTVTTDDLFWNFYQNDILISTQAAQSISLNQFKLGTGGPGFYFDGQLDDIRLYNRVLNLSEISTLALRRGIAYETKRVSRGKAYAASPASSISFRRSVLI